MRLVVQRVTSASVEVENEIIGQIDDGYMVLVSFCEGDTKKEADWGVRKLLRLRIFPDDDGRMNLSVKDINGSLLLIPQFTLYGDVSHNNRPSFNKAMGGEEATELFDYFYNKCAEEIPTEKGEFGAFMKVSLLNNGPVTILIEKEYNE